MQPALSNSSSALLSSLSLSLSLCASDLSCRSEISVGLPIRPSLSFTGNHLLPLLFCPRAVADAGQKEADQPDKGTHPKPFLFPPYRLLSLFPFPSKGSVGRVAGGSWRKTEKKKKKKRGP
ncbi:heat shock protein DnaJ [Musa troglodytarum]|uniref:Heat shock protein DnaJ n=1 Tax=Musa troglodytarum TaxID=320322 RepID=A0A9E7I689_9LILI|nr:heat shock protein DnaJ [Musa troglodytarum]URE42193.1 heat shock protein DnaJ [Musa troglodytarum]